MSAKATFWAWEQKEVKGTALILLLHIADCANEQGQAWFRYETAMERCRVNSKTTISKAIQELETLGLLSKEVRYGCAKGKVVKRSNLYQLNIVSPDSVRTESGLTDSPESGLTDSPDSVRYESTNEPTNEPTNNLYAKHGLKILLPDWLPVSAFNDFVEDRKSRKKKPTQKAAELAIGTLTKLRDDGHDPVAVINQSIERAYTGLFPINGGTTRGTNQSKRSNSNGFAEPSQGGFETKIPDGAPEFLRD